MKPLIVSLAFSIAAFATIHERKVVVDGKHYLVSYDVYDCDPPREERGCLVEMPALAGAQPHSSASITVVEVQTGKILPHSTIQWPSAIKIQVASFPGKWTPNGCFEDDPATLVKYALKHQYDDDDLSDEPSNLGLIPSASVSGISIATVPLCNIGQIELRPVLESGFVVIHARACVAGAWETAKVKVEP